MERHEIEAVGCALYQAAEEKRVIQAPVMRYPQMTYEEAYQIQQVMVRRYLDGGYHLAGRKIGLTSQAMRELAGVHEPDYGCVFRELCFENESRVSRSLFLTPSVEAELAFVLKEDLTGEGITSEQVLEATDYLVGALEIVDMRQSFQGQSVLNSIADNACFGGYVLGDVPVRPKTVDLELLGVVLYKNNEPIDSSCGAAVMGSPAVAAAWLANKMAALGEPLRRGEVLLTGSFLRAVPIQQGDTVRALFAHVGEVGLTLV